MSKAKQKTVVTDTGGTGHGSTLATAGGFGTILLWSTTVAFVRRLSEDVGPVTAGAAVYSVSGLIALISLLRCSRRRQEIWQLPGKYLVGCGALLVGYTLLLFLAIGYAKDHEQVLEVGLLNYLWPTLTLVLSLVILGQKANWALVPGTLLALAGVFLVVTQGEIVSWESLARNVASNPVVYLLALAAAVFWALYSNLACKWAGGQKEGAMTLFLPVTAVLLFLICCFVNEPRKWSPRAVAELLFLGVATYFSYALWDNAMRRGNVVAVAAASYLTPLFSTIISCFYLAIVPETKLLVGCGALILGSILSWHSVNRASRKPLAPSTAATPALSSIATE